MNHHFTSDLHLGHFNVLRHDQRPWDTIEVHDAALIAMCRPAPEYAGKHNELWILGDVAARAENVEKLMNSIRKFWSKIHLIRGNHDDRSAWKLRHLFDSANEALYLRVSPKVRLYLSHYAHRTWRNSHHGSYHLHGHSHGALPRLGRSMDVGVNVNGYRPVSLERVIEELENQPTTEHH